MPTDYPQHGRPPHSRDDDPDINWRIQQFTYENAAITEDLTDLLPSGWLADIDEDDDNGIAYEHPTWWPLIPLAIVVAVLTIALGVGYGLAHYIR